MENKQITIQVFDEVGGSAAICVDDGNNIFKKIDHAITNEVNVVLSFQNIELIITAFLNAAIGQLYSKYTSEQIKAYLQITNVRPEDKRLFNMVIERAKDYFSNPDSFDESINAEMGHND
jgi:hypothetical protein